MTNENDIHFMKLALELAKEARIHSPPNPWVGCLIVKNNEIVGKGSTQPTGRPHAEMVAIDAAGEKAHDATAYVTLEPCTHHGRSLPCANALIQAKVARVVIAIEDPDRRVSGEGIDKLRHAGITVNVGICAEEATSLLEPYLYQRRTGLPYCILKAAVSIDGRIAAADASSKWISSPAARQDVHLLRAESQAILIGAGTALNDKPMLTARNVTPLPHSQLLRVLLDATGCVLPDSALFDQHLGKTLVFTSHHCNPDSIKQWQQAGIMVEIVSTTDDRHLNLQEILKKLGNRGIIQLIVEGGSTIFGSFIKTSLWNKLVIYFGARILGDSGLPLFRDYFISSIEEAPTLHLLKTQQFEDCIRADYSTYST